MKPTIRDTTAVIRRGVEKEAVSTRSPRQQWEDFCTALAQGKSTALKVTDNMVDGWSLTDDDDDEEDDNEVSFTSTMITQRDWSQQRLYR